MWKRWIAAGAAGLLVAGVLMGGVPASAEPAATYELTAKAAWPDRKPAQEAELRLAPLTSSYGRPTADGKRWSTAPFYPSWRTFGRADRRGDRMVFDLMSHTDQDGHPRDSPLDTQSMKLYRGGRLLGSAAGLSLQVNGLPARTATYRLEAKYSRPTWSPLSVSTSVVWTFRSRAIAAETALPLQTIRFRPPIDADNLVRRTSVTVLPFQADSRGGVPAARSAKLQYSGDDGKTWRRAAVVRKNDGTFVAYFPTPKGAFVSLRAQLTGPAKSTVDQTLIRAYKLS